MVIIHHDYLILIFTLMSLSLSLNIKKKKKKDLVLFISHTFPLCLPFFLSHRRFPDDNDARLRVAIF